MHETFSRGDIQKTAAASIANAAPPVVCENCGTPLDTRDDAINFAHFIVIGSPGKASLAGFQCDAKEHWACSRDCIAALSHACLDEHMLPTLDAIHTELKKRTDTYVKAVTMDTSNTTLEGNRNG